ncbi:MAG: hypothetical protein DI535_14130 [Citrobacter freundii]|nr:MAG: hypothetical protein DI535_14130 [Citrobacter freundii]
MSNCRSDVPDLPATKDHSNTAPIRDGNKEEVDLLQALPAFGEKGEFAGQLNNKGAGENQVLR